MKKKVLVTALLCVSLALFGCGKSETPKARDELNKVVGFTFYDNVRNDTTGKWKRATCATSEDIIPYIDDYYAAYFESDDELHAIQNFSTNTTSAVRVEGDDLWVEVHERVEGEELDAGKLFSGDLIKTYVIDKSSGEIKDEFNAE